MTRVPLAAEARVHSPSSLAEAVELLGSADDPAVPLAGGTGVLRGHIGNHGFAPAYVLVSRLEELRVVERERSRVIVGAAVTHAGMADALAGIPQLAGLANAAAKSATATIRRMATVGGNLATPFPAADLVPALLATDADVELTDGIGSRTLPLADYLQQRLTLPQGTLLTRIVVPVRDGVSAHERLTLRRAGDYPVAIVHTHVNLADGVVREATVAIGAVEKVARIWHSLSERLLGRPLDVDAATMAARELTAELSPRDATDCDGWYRLQVLPTLVGRTIRTLQATGGQ